MIIRKLFTLYILFLFLPFFVFSQKWNQNRFDGIYGLGATNLMSEVGAPDASKVGFIGENFWLTPQAFRPVLYFGGRYMPNEQMGIKVNLSLANLAAADTYGGFRWENRITNVYLIELSAQYEYFIFKEKQRRNVYRLSTYRWYKNINIPTYVFIGIGESLFFPKTQINERYIGNLYYFDGKPTEYKKIFNRPESYKKTSLVIPFGIGVNFRLNKIIRMGIEAGYRFAFTDYLDEVYRPLTEDYAWPDSYQFLLVTLNYKLKTGRSGLPRLRFR